MTRRLRQTVSLACALVMLLSAAQITPFVASALGSEVEKIDIDRTAPKCDVSVMTFNILEYDTSHVGYDSPANRFPNVVDTIVNYMPDIVGIQEAADAHSLNGNLDWNYRLAKELDKYGYAYRQLTDESEYPSTGMTIGAGLMIFYKAERFDLIDSDSEQYGGTKGVTGTDGTRSHIDNSRFFQWVKLWDNEYKTFVYAFNTHLAINSSYSDADNVKIGCHKRTQQLAQLSNRMKELADNVPCFSTGDYNCQWNNSTQNDTYYHQLYYLTEDNIFGDSAKDAENQLNTGLNSAIDHVFYNKTTSHVLEYRTLYEDYDSYQPSDHKAMIGYYNYTPSVSFGSGKIDYSNKHLTDTTDTAAYTFDITLPAHTSYKIYDENGKKISSDTVSLSKRTNNFTIKFFNPDATESNSREISHLTATITYTGALRPTVSSKDAINSYFGKDGIHLLTEKDTVSLTVENGTLTDTGNTISGLTPGTAVYHIESDTGEIFPLYIHRATTTAKAGKYLYIDDDIGNSTGMVAFTNDEDVIFVKSATNGFSNFIDAAKIANLANGYTVYVAPGHYNETETITFSKDITLLGNNYDTTTLTRNDTEWSLAARKSETTLENNLVFNKNNNHTITVKGFEFVGTKVYAPLYFNYNNPSYLLTLDISHNIFKTNGTNLVNASCIHLNTQTQKTGRIYDNYFESVGKSTTATSRVLTCRNPNGLNFEENFCKGFSQESRNIFFITSEISAQNTQAVGYGNFTAQYNRFENCSGFSHYITNIAANRQAHYAYRYNDFVRCGYLQGQTLSFNMNEVDGVPNHYENASINVYGNRFINCYRSVWFSRSSNLQDDMRDMDIAVEQNRFIDTNQYQAYRTVQLSLYAGTDKTIGLDVDWSFAYNYFTAGNITDNDPKHHMLLTMTDANGISGDCINLANNAYPYYTDVALTKLSTGTVPTQSGITIGQTAFDYNGRPHSVEITAPDDAIISYSTDPSEKRAYTRQAPSLTEIGEMTVYFQIERAGYRNYTGSFTLKVNAMARELSLTDIITNYNGKNHTFSVNSVSGDQITCLVNGTAYNDIPSFTLPGVYEYQITIINPLYVTVSGTATLTIKPLTLSAIDAVGFTVPYDGESHTIAVTAINGETVEYSVDGGAFTTVTPTFDDVCDHSVTVRFSKVGYTSVEKTVAAVITALPPYDIAATGYYGKADGQPHLGEIIGLAKDDTLTYSIDGITYTDTAPVFTQNGAYNYYVKISRRGYDAVIFNIPVVLGDTPAPYTVVTTRAKEGITFSFTADLSVLQAENIALISYGHYEGSTFVPIIENAYGIMSVPTAFTLQGQPGDYGALTFTYDGLLSEIISVKVIE